MFFSATAENIKNEEGPDHAVSRFSV